MHVFQYSSRPIFNSDQHVPATQELWCKKSDEAARSQGAGRGADWTSVALNNRGKERQPIRLSIHLFGRSRYAAVLRAATYTSSSAEPITQTDPRVVRLLEVEGAPVSFHAVLLPSSFPATRPSRTPFPGQQHAVERTLQLHFSLVGTDTTGQLTRTVCRAGPDLGAAAALDGQLVAD